MAHKKILLLEAAGGVFTAAASLFMQHLYSLRGQELLGILFGAVNGSVWEACKTLLFPFLIWALLEALIYRMAVYKYTAAKTISLYALGVLYLFLRQTALNPHIAAAVSVSAAIALSVILYTSPLPLQKLFVPSLLFLFLFISMYFSLTPFAPHLKVFRDPETGLYGILPRHFDYGAFVFDSMYLGKISHSLLK